MPEPYMTEQALEHLSLAELTLKISVLRQQLTAQEAAFVSKKKWILEELDVPVNWFLRNGNPDSQLKGSIIYLQAALSGAKDIIALDAILSQWIKTLKIEEGGNYPASTSLAYRLENLQARLCSTGHLPRCYLTQVRPLILGEFTAMRKKFSKHTQGLLTPAIQRQVDMLDLLEQSLGAALSEEDAEQSIAQAIRDTEQLICDHKNTSVLFSYAVRKTLGFDTHQTLLTTLNHFKKALSEKACLQPLAVFSADFVSLKQAVYWAEQRLVDRQKSFQARKEDLIQAQQAALQSVISFKPHLPGPVSEYLVLRESNLANVPQSVDLDDEKTAVLELSRNYALFWQVFADHTAWHAYVWKNPLSDAWREIHEKLLCARQDLQSKGYLIPTYAQDRRHLLIEAYDTFINRAYKNTLIRRGEVRAKQLAELRDALWHCHSAEAASALIWDKIYKIEEHHQVASVLYNLVPFRKPSRAVQALKAFEAHCRGEQWLPQAAVVPRTLLTPVITRFREAVDRHFQHDIIYSNRAYRHHATTLLRRLREVDDAFRSGDVSFIAAQEMMAGYVEEAIDTVKLIEKPRGIHRLFSCWLPSAGITLSQTLLEAKGELQEGAQPLVPSYRYSILPKMMAALTQALKDYAAEDVPQSTTEKLATPFLTAGKFAANCAATVVGADLPYEDRGEGAKKGRELLLSLSDGVVNAQHAKYMLEVGMKALAGTHPLLVERITQAIAPLIQEGTLPSLALSEFGQFMRDEVKKEAEKVAEFRKRVDRIGKYKEGLDKLENKPAGPSNVKINGVLRAG